MIYIKTDENNFVESINFKPFDSEHGLGKTEADLLIEGFLVESIPEPDQIEGQSAKMFYTEADGFTFQYEDIPPTPEELQAENNNAMAEYLVDLDFRICSIELGL
ncbi:MAG: hypothetical protein CVU99_03555 [Firmicutes bacterium HGW-Firmicutes-4]|jgi:hypothetical protein|nr:MAG: hypothetical protein CVU99_03555 [Firmicutes bacterium HGW-Firmicutes-4]